MRNQCKFINKRINHENHYKPPETVVKLYLTYFIKSHCRQSINVLVTCNSLRKPFGKC